MNKHRKLEFLCHLTKKVANVSIEPYYAIVKDYEDPEVGNDSAQLFGPLLRNILAFSVVETVKTLVTGKPPNSSEYNVLTNILIPEGFLETPTLLFGGLAVRKSYDALKDKFRYAFRK